MFAKTKFCIKRMRSTFSIYFYMKNQLFPGFTILYKIDIYQHPRTIRITIVTNMFRNIVI